jgi:peptidoglycan/xylan/chitin deacetylase (PgdA/CDA1 family)
MWGRLRPIVRDLVADSLHVSRLTRPKRRLLTIVTFHRVLPPDYFERYPLREIAVTTDEFEWFVAFFAAHYSCFPLAEAWRLWNTMERTPRPLLAITFDDGQLDNHRYARPILERKGVRASFYVPIEAIEENGTLWHDRLAYAATALMGKDSSDARGLFAQIGGTSHPDERATILDGIERAKRLAPDRRIEFVERMEKALGGPARPDWDGMMTWDDLRAMAAAGHEIGSHSMSHGILPLLDDDALDYEIRDSRRALEDHLDVAVDTFCYPNGDYDARTLDRVKKHGYRLGVTTKWGPNDSASTPFELTRVDVQGQHARSRGGRMSEARMAWRMSRWFSGPS